MRARPATTWHGAGRMSREPGPRPSRESASRQTAPLSVRTSNDFSRTSMAPSAPCRGTSSGRPASQPERCPNGPGSRGTRGRSPSPTTRSAADRGSESPSSTPGPNLPASQIMSRERTTSSPPTSLSTERAFRQRPKRPPPVGRRRSEVCSSSRPCSLQGGPPGIDGGPGILAGSISRCRRAAPHTWRIARPCRNPWDRGRLTARTFHPGSPDRCPGSGGH